MAKLSGESTAPTTCKGVATLGARSTSDVGAAARQFAASFGSGLKAVAVCAALVYVGPAYAITIEFNYDMDLTGFFGADDEPTEARTALEFVARAFTPISDNLAAISPAGTDSWSAFFPNPGARITACACNIAVPGDTLIVYVGAHDLPDGQIAQAGPGNWGVDDPMSASPAFRSAVANRGQGSVVDDFAPWGGSLAFDTAMPNGSARIWHFDVDAPPAYPAYDFASTAVHELAHILGFGVSASFRNKAFQDEFTGAAASALYGGPVPLSDDDAHWAPGVSSPPYLVDPPQAALGPSLAAGERKLLTPLDYAALADIGWQVPDKSLALPGDLDNDADVDGSDLLMLQRRFGLAGTTGDANGDGWVNDYDRWLLEQNFGAVGAQSLKSLPTPEPAGAALCLIALGAFAWRLSAKRSAR